MSAKSAVLEMLETCEINPVRIEDLQEFNHYLERHGTDNTKFSEYLFMRLKGQQRYKVGWSIQNNIQPIYSLTGPATFVRGKTDFIFEVYKCY